MWWTLSKHDAGLWVLLQADEEGHEEAEGAEAEQGEHAGMEAEGGASEAAGGPASVIQESSEASPSPDTGKVATWKLDARPPSVCHALHYCACIISFADSCSPLCCVSSSCVF